MNVPKRERLVALRDVAAVLARHGRLRAGITMDSEDGYVTVQIILPHEADETAGLDAVSCADDLQHLADVATLYALCKKYDIPVDGLEAAINRKE